MSDLQNTTVLKTSSVGKSALVTDLDTTYVSDQMYTHARNIMPATHLGNKGSKTNEIATLNCYKTELDFCGSIELTEDRIIVFSGIENGLSEIGILNYNTCNYSKVVSSNCLGFNPCNIVTGVAKTNFKNEIIITFGGKGYKTRRINLSKIPYKYKEKEDLCKTKDFNEELDCEQTLLFPNISIPCSTFSTVESGNLPNGSYALAMSYETDNIRFSDWYALSYKIHLFNQSNTNSIQFTLSNLDKDFDKYRLALIGNINGTKTIYNIGSFNTSQESISISSLPIDTIPFQEFTLRKTSWESASIITSNSKYLILADLVSLPELNYQPQAFKIKAKIIVEQVPVDFYKQDSDSFSYWADEVYDFGIEWVHKSGYIFPKSHIANRLPNEEELSIATGDDVFELDESLKDCSNRKDILKWEVENTAGDLISLNNDFVCNRRIAYEADFGYWESSHKYPNNPDVYGSNSCSGIRLFKFIDRCKVPRFEIINGQKYINILGVSFDNIEYPLDKNGNPVEGIVGYRIVRSSREGSNRSVISAGMVSNYRSYQDNQEEKTIYYPNYGANSLAPDPFLSSTQTSFKNAKENNYTPISTVHQDRFAYYSPHNHFDLPYKPGNQWIFETEDEGEIVGAFDNVYSHPKSTLLTNFALYLSLGLGLLQAYLALKGKKCKTVTFQEKVSPTDPSTVTTDIIEECETLFAGLPVSKTILGNTNDAAEATANPAKKALDFLKRALSTVLAAVSTTYLTLDFAENILRAIYNYTRPTDYALQYNGKTNFNSSKCIKKGNKRRISIRDSKLLSSNIVTVNGDTINNYSRENSIYLHINKPIIPTIISDSSLSTISTAGICNNPKQSFSKPASMMYVRNKIYNPSQYGPLGSSNIVLITPCIKKVEYIKNKTFSTGLLYGGDCVLGNFAIQKKMPFFRQNLATTINNDLPSNFPDNTEYDYRLYRNVGYARFWMDSSKYDTSQIFTTNIKNFTRFSRTLTSKHNLDCKYKDKENVFRVDNAYFYTSHNTVLEFVAEADFNFVLRSESQYPHYGQSNDLKEIFKAPLLWKPETFKVDKGFYDLEYKELLNINQREDYKKTDIQISEKNSVIYSLPSFNLQSIDNWRYIPSGNYFSFQSSDYGNLTAIHKLSQDRLIFLFDNASPFVSMGQDFLELDNSGRKVTVGDGGLFAQDPREVMPTDNNYGSCQSKTALSSNHLGIFYPSEKHGRQHRFTEGIEDFSREGNHYWHKTYMPLQLKKYFPNYKEEDNTICKVGYLMVFDSTFEILYTIKRDYIPIIKEITYNNIKKQFEYEGISVSLKDPLFFKDISWTLSYDPIEKGFISWHDWHPDWIIQTDRHFLSVKDNLIVKHNERCDLFCNYYGKDFPFEIEPLHSTGQQVTSERSLTWHLEAQTYKNDCRDKFHRLNDNFDTLVVHNSEQISPYLTLVHPPTNHRDYIQYPKRNTIGYDIVYSKEEQMYSANGFWDATKDRGEFTNQELQLWNIDESGYKKTINSNAINLDSRSHHLERPKFRHIFTKYWFAKKVSNNVQYVIKFFNSLKLNSPR